MRRLNEKGELNTLLIPLILACVLLVVVIAIAFSFFNQKQHYKNDSDQITKSAVTAAKTDQKKADSVFYAEEAKNPLREYRGPSDFGSLIIKYPRTWSVYVNQSNGGTIIDGYGYPGVVPSPSSDSSTAYALRFQLQSSTYDSVVSQLEQQVATSKLKIVAYKPAQVKGVVGVRVTGQIQPNKSGEMVILPIRNQTLEIWTESSKYMNDFSKYILPNFSFNP